MSRRLEVELTSRRDDGVWTWRAAGAKQPKGEVDGGLLYDGASVGDVVRADAEFFVDGIEILTVLPPKARRERAVETIQVVGSGRTEELVTTQLAGKGGRGKDGRGKDGRGKDGRKRRDRGDRTRRDSGRGEADGGRGRPRDRDEKKRSRDGGRSGGDNRGERGTDRNEPRDEKPKPKRLRAKRIHRAALLESLPAEQRPVAEQVLRGGIPAVRQGLDKQNEEAKAQGLPEVKPDAIVRMAEELLPATRTAEWRDRAEAALADIDEVDLRDIRSVVNAAETAARSDETRALAQQLRDGLVRRAEEEHKKWLAELSSAVAEDRLVRALRLSSHPPKAGSPIPADLKARLKGMTEAGLSDDVSQQRFATVLDALAYSPIHAVVVPSGHPDRPDGKLLAIVRKHAGRLPQIAALFGVEITPPKRSRKKSPPPPPTDGPGSAPAAPTEVAAAEENAGTAPAGDVEAMQSRPEI